MLVPRPPILVPSLRLAPSALVGALVASLAVLAAPAARAACDPGMPIRSALMCLSQASNQQAAATAALEASLAAAQAELASTRAELATTRAELSSTQAELAWTSAEAAALRAEVDGLLGAGLATQAWVEAQGFASEAWVLAQDFVAAMSPTLSALLDYLWVDPVTHELGFEGADVYVTNGRGATGLDNGRGNLIVGYAESYEYQSRTGSHNLVIGPYHEWTSHGGLVAGFGNTTSGEWATVSGGRWNEASGTMASVTGGESNEAIGTTAWVGGGKWNASEGEAASICGGWANEASGRVASVSGGVYNSADGDFSSVLGGRDIIVSATDETYPAGP